MVNKSETNYVIKTKLRLMDSVHNCTCALKVSGKSERWFNFVGFDFHQSFPKY